MAKSISVESNALDVVTWERAEIERSVVEASQTPDRSLRLGPRTRRRYLAPPADTCFPLEYAYHLLGNVAGKPVLDLGCGSGENTTLLALRGGDVTAVDISAALIDLAKRRLRVNGVDARVRFIVGSAHELPVPDDSFDVVFGIAVLHHLDLNRVAGEVARVLRPGGRAIFQEPVRNSKLVRFARALIPYRASDVSPFERPLTDGELAELGSRFSRMQTRAFSLPHVNVGQALPITRRHVDRLHDLDRRMLLAAPRLAKFAGIRVIELVK